MAYRPPFTAISSLIRYEKLSTTANHMNIAKPLTRAVASSTQKRSHSYGSIGPYYPFPKIPRPRRNVLYYSNWTSARKGIRLSRRNYQIKNNLRNFKFPTQFRFFSSEARQERRRRRSFLKWWTLTTISVIIGGVFTKIGYEQYHESQHEIEDSDDEGDSYPPRNKYEIKPHSWQLYAYSTLPLKTISRLWGQVNSIELPIWLREPTYKLYSSAFGVNLTEMEQPDLTKYHNLSEFFYRTLRPGVRPVSDAELVAPSDGKVLKFGVIENGEIEQVKGMTYSIDALLGLNTKKLAAPSHDIEFLDADLLKNDDIIQRNEEFANLNGISYTLDDILGGENPETTHFNDLTYKDEGDAASLNSVSSQKENKVADAINEPNGQNQGKNLYFAVIYLAPGDYHRFHAPTNWVATLRRHFIGELFSVAPFFQKTLQGLFVLNERVALLGYWKYGFFSMIPVGATNVGSIIVNFDKDLRTNDIYEHEVYSRSDAISIDSGSSTPKKALKNTVYEATYKNASEKLGGHPMIKGQEVGGFKLGSTVVLVFEAPNNFKFDVNIGEKVKMGQKLGGFE